MSFSRSIQVKQVFFILFFFIGITLFAQTGKIQGKVTENSVALPFVIVRLQGTEKVTRSDESGLFVFDSVYYGSYILQIESAEHIPFNQPIELRQTLLDLGTVGLTRSNELEEVAVFGKTKAEEVREQAFTVTSLDMKPLKNLNVNVNQVLNQSTGVRIRQQGGLGSDFEFSLSGFTGNQVRFFVDGLPTEALGSAYNINSLPVNNVERIEIYKGVVPVHLGADVLGGAVNIVTSSAVKNYLDVSYSYGSFNTNQASVTGRYNLKKGLVINVSAFYNYSDNFYKTEVFLFDKETGTKDTTPTNITRFHDAFRSMTGSVEFGIVNKRFADRLMLGIIGTQQYKELQNGANITEVFGEVFTRQEGFIPTLKYEKSNLFFPNLSLKVASVYSRNYSQNVDTSSREYDWTGEYTTKFTYQSSGEISWYKTLFKFRDESALTIATLNYKIGRKHEITLNNTYSYLMRVGVDEIAVAPVPFDNPNVISKNFTGLSYQAKLLDERLMATAFVKLFHLTSSLYEEVYVEELDENVIRKLDDKQVLPGYGAAVSYFALKNLLLKVSYENTCRLPEGYELFGNGLLLLPNPTLQPEKSKNFNAGFLAGKRFKNHVVNLEFNYLYRLPTNLIRSVAVGVQSVYQNLGFGKINCLEGGINYRYKRLLNVEFNATLQNMRNISLKSNGEPDDLYGDRLPNIPYLFSNAAISLNSKSCGKYKRTIGFNWNTLFVEQFYLKWESLGYLDTKFVIPRQLVSSAAITASSHNGRYNLSLSCNNLFDAKAYDNFKVQKPGRSFNVKLRYYLSKQ